MQRERLTITLDNELLTAVDRLINKDTLRNRSQTIEHLLKEGLGLHQLDQAFLFFEEEYHDTDLFTLLQLCTASNLTHLFLSLSSLTPDLTHRITTTISQQFPHFNLTVVPSEFGSGGAVILQKEKLENPFLLAWLRPQLSLPSSLLSPYLFHRQHNTLLTQLLTTNGSTFSFAGLAIAQPELISHIPAGIVSLEETVFPELVKAAKVRGYLFSPNT